MKGSYLKSKFGDIYLPTDEEDAEINRGIAEDPDTFEATDEEWKEFKTLSKPGMYIETEQHGRFYRPPEEESTEINQGIAADHATYELTDEQIDNLKPWDQLQA